MANEANSNEAKAPVPEAQADDADPGADVEVEPSEDLGVLTVAEAAAWKGWKLDEIGGASVGRVADVYVDERSGDPEWLLARMGRFGHYCLVPARYAVGAGGRVWVPFSRELIRKAPRIESGKPLERDAERTLLEHYGIATTEAGRGADLAQRDEGVTALPHGA